MLAALIVTFRETLEAALVVGIILAYLRKAGDEEHEGWVWYGLFGAIILSMLMAYLFERFLGGFQGFGEELYEGVIVMTAVGLLTWLILWMFRQRHNLKANIENKVDGFITKSHPFGILTLVFVSVMREGVETMIFLRIALFRNDGAETFVGAIVGVFSAVVVGYFLFKGIFKFSLRRFFSVTGVILILFSAGMFAYGIHEFQEAGILPTYYTQVWDTGMIVHENGLLGEILKGVFGYNSDPTLIEVIGYWAYLVFMFLGWGYIERKK